MNITREIRVKALAYHNKNFVEATLSIKGEWESEFTMLLTHDEVAQLPEWYQPDKAFNLVMSAD